MNLGRTLSAAAAVLLLVRAAGAAPSDAAAFVSTSTAVSDSGSVKPLLDDFRLAEIVSRHPGAALRPVDPDVHDDGERPGGGRRFVFRFALSGCATCEELADARVAFDYDGDLHYLGPRLLTVGNPPLFAVEGDAVRGKDFEARIDAARVFRLKAFSEGWVVGVMDERNNNYCSVVTPPYRGTNHLEIFGLSVSTSGERRSFRCVETPADFAAAEKSLRLVLGDDKSTWKESDEAYQLHGLLADAAQRGALTISRVELGNVGAGRRPWIESLHFRFELRPSGEKAP